MIVVAKIGSSSVTTAAGDVDVAAVEKLCGEVARLRGEGHQVVSVEKDGNRFRIRAIKRASHRLEGEK